MTDQNRTFLVTPILSHQQVLDVGLDLDGLGVAERGDDEAFFVVLVPDVDTRVLFRPEQVRSKQALALGHHRTLDCQQVRNMEVSALVRNRGLRVGQTGHFYGVQCLSLVVGTVDAVAVYSQDRWVDPVRVFVKVPRDGVFYVLAQRRHPFEVKVWLRFLCGRLIRVHLNRLGTVVL